MGESKDFGLLLSKISTAQSAKKPDGNSSKQELHVFSRYLSVPATRCDIF